MMMHKEKRENKYDSKYDQNSLTANCMIDACLYDNVSHWYPDAIRQCPYADIK